MGLTSGLYKGYKGAILGRLYGLHSGGYCGRTKVRPTSYLRPTLLADPFSPIDSSTEHLGDSAGTLK